MFAAVILILAASGSGQDRCRSVYAHAVEQAHAADRAIARHDFRSANLAIDAGLAILGDAYASPAMNDNTGMHLVLAAREQRRGKLRQSAEMKRRILAERLKLCGPKSRAPAPD